MAVPFAFLYSFHVFSYQWRIQDFHKGEANISPQGGTPSAPPGVFITLYYPSFFNNEATLHPWVIVESTFFSFLLFVTTPCPFLISDDIFKKKTNSWMFGLLAAKSAYVFLDINFSTNGIKWIKAFLFDRDGLGARSCQTPISDYFRFKTLSSVHSPLVVPPYQWGCPNLDGVLRVRGAQVPGLWLELRLGNAGLQKKGWGLALDLGLEWRGLGLESLRPWSCPWILGLWPRPRGSYPWPWSRNFVLNYNNTGTDATVHSETNILIYIYIH